MSTLNAFCNTGTLAKSAFVKLKVRFTSPYLKEDIRDWINILYQELRTFKKAAAGRYALDLLSPDTVEYDLLDLLPQTGPWLQQFMPLFIAANYSVGSRSVSLRPHLAWLCTEVKRLLRELASVFLPNGKGPVLSIAEQNERVVQFLAVVLDAEALYASMVPGDAW